ncbi:MAG: hypothetical protein M1830_001810 [Pleopsidium flavum]|nr:MAG: hypothetical protein M1830_002488 [Pleopsidium flavum]KAI9878127.1 MAG: hypothetical protein M1830_001810 [Pleopsidium flavum]
MESVIFQDSPLAEYLEGEGEGQPDWASSPTAKEPTSPQTQSFAPRGPSLLQFRFRRKVPQPLTLKVPQKGAVASLHDSCSRAVNSRLGRAENERFLEQFRYIVVASQLLSDHANPTYYNPGDRQGSSLSGSSAGSQKLLVSLSGTLITAASAFAFVWILHWARGGKNAQWSQGRISIVVILFFATTTTVYAYVRRQWLQYLRHQAVESATLLVSSAQEFDASASATITLVQEVELVSRGYRISSPLPPITRLDEQSQTKRCARLRRTLHSCLGSILVASLQACNVLRSLVEELDLEKYFEVYEISPSDLHDIGLEGVGAESEEVENLKSLKKLLYRLHTIRRIFLCSLLALDADGGKPDFARWGVAVGEMQRLASITVPCTEKLNNILGEEERKATRGITHAFGTKTHINLGFALSPAPRVPLTPDRERMRVQLRKLSSLSQGIRGLQAKMHVLREESDKTLDESEDISELGSNLMAQYESIGADLRSVMQDWENGKATLALNINKHERQISLSSNGVKSPLSPTFSLGGLTVVGNSPSDALKVLNGDDRSRSSVETSGSDEEIFEAIAAPRQRSQLSREERIAKMKQDRVKQASAREKAAANTHMLRELETVINLRPKTRTTGLLEARLEQANLLKKVVEAIKDLVQDCNFDCNDSGIALQAMDNSHVALVSMMLKAESFSPFRCDRNIALGINLTSLTKVLRCAQNEDILTLKAEDAPDVVNLVFESSESDRLSEYDIKLMDIDQEHLGIPETEYAATISMPSAEFQKICRDLMALSESVSIEATKEGVKFACTGDIGNGAVTLRGHTNVDKPEMNVSIDLTEPVALTFSLKYLVNFCKASGLSGQVKLCLSNEVPLLVEYALAGSSYLRFYLAPKIGDEE